MTYRAIFSERHRANTHHDLVGTAQARMSGGRTTYLDDDTKHMRIVHDAKEDMILIQIIPTETLASIHKR